MQKFDWQNESYRFTKLWGYYFSFMTAGANAVDLFVYWWCAATYTPHPPMIPLYFKYDPNAFSGKLIFRFEQFKN